MVLLSHACPRTVTKPHQDTRIVFSQYILEMFLWCIAALGLTLLPGAVELLSVTFLRYVVL